MAMAHEKPVRAEGGLQQTSKKVRPSVYNQKGLDPAINYMNVEVNPFLCEARSEVNPFLSVSLGSESFPVRVSLGSESFPV